jgi:hypothetical protein
MENFITGYAGHEYQVRKELKKVLGEEKYEYFFDKVSSSRSTGRSLSARIAVPCISSLGLPIADKPVLGVFLPRRGCQAFRFTRAELFAAARE